MCIILGECAIRRAAFVDSPYVFSQGCIIDQKNKVTMETQKHLSVFSSPCLFLTLLNLMNGSSHVEKGHSEKSEKFRKIFLIVSKIHIEFDINL